MQYSLLVVRGEHKRENPAESVSILGVLQVGGRLMKVLLDLHTKAYLTDPFITFMERNSNRNNIQGGKKVQTDSFRKQIDDQSDVKEDEAKGHHSTPRHYQRMFCRTITKAGKTRPLMVWTNSMSEDIMCCYFLVTQTKIKFRPQLH